MPGFLLLAPTGSGKSWACKHHPFFASFAIDGDSLIDWSKVDWSASDWTPQDRKHLETVLSRMRDSGKCVCWYVGTTAIADALYERRLSKDEIAIVLIPQDEHLAFVEKRMKKGHDWKKATSHRALCEKLVRDFRIPCFASLDDAADYVRASLDTGVDPKSL